MNVIFLYPFSVLYLVEFCLSFGNASKLMLSIISIHLTYLNLFCGMISFLIFFFKISAIFYIFFWLQACNGLHDIYPTMNGAVIPFHSIRVLVFMFCGR